MRKLVKSLREHQLTAYFLLAYGITWSLWVPLLIGVKRGWWGSEPWVIALLIAGSFGPFLSGGLLTWISDRSVWDWFSQALKWRVSARWWLAALGIPLAFYGLMTLIHLAMGGQLDWSQMRPLLALPGIYFNIFLWGGGNEELGWRGFALPRLQEKFSPLLSSLIIGVIWTIWHAPAGIVELGFAGWALDLPLYTISVTGISVVATWLYNGSGGSVLLAMLFHAGINGAQALYPVQGLFSLTGELARTLTWLLALLIFGLLMGGRLYRKKRRSRAPLDMPLPGKSH